jgi:hypothetical protein
MRLSQTKANAALRHPPLKVTPVLGGHAAMKTFQQVMLLLGIAFLLPTTVVTAAAEEDQGRPRICERVNVMKWTLSSTILLAVIAMTPDLALAQSAQQATTPANSPIMAYSAPSSTSPVCYYEGKRSDQGAIVPMPGGPRECVVESQEGSQFRMEWLKP